MTWCHTPPPHILPSVQEKVIDGLTKVYWYHMTTIPKSHISNSSTKKNTVSIKINLKILFRKHIKIPRSFGGLDSSEWHNSWCSDDFFIPVIINYYPSDIQNSCTIVEETCVRDIGSSGLSCMDNHRDEKNIS